MPYKDRKSYRVEAGATVDDNTLKIDFYAPPGDYKFVFRNAEGTVIQTKTITNPDTSRLKSKFTAEFNHQPEDVEMDSPPGAACAAPKRSISPPSRRKQPTRCLTGR